MAGPVVRGALTIGLLGMKQTARLLTLFAALVDGALRDGCGRCVSPTVYPLLGRAFKSGACYAPYHIPSGFRSAWRRAVSRHSSRRDGTLVAGGAEGGHDPTCSAINTVRSVLALGAFVTSVSISRLFCLCRIGRAGVRRGLVWR
jgi:hypothetical protein